MSAHVTILLSNGEVGHKKSVDLQTQQQTPNHSRHVFRFCFSINNGHPPAGNRSHLFPRSSEPDCFVFNRMPSVHVHVSAQQC
jgi:hypothetical protein